MTYTRLLRLAQLATTREEARKYLAIANDLQLLESTYHRHAFDKAVTS